ncbi:MAG: YafY family protein [Candidatus Zixiibacteriota bacterium]
MTKYDRLLYILNLLRTRRNLNAARLALECGVTERSIYRDIISLSEANVPIYFDNGYKLASDNFLPPLNLDFEEYSCLKMAIESTPLQKTGTYTKTLKRIRAKIEAGLSDIVREKKKTAVESTYIDIAVSLERERAELYYGLIEEAVRNLTCLQIDYDSIQSGRTTRVVEPYFIVFRGRAFYFVAYCRSRQDFRTFRMDRVLAVTPLREKFRPKQGITAQSYFEGSWEVYSGESLTVVVEFTGAAARVIASGTHHVGERVEPLKGGLVRYTVTVRGLEEIRRWLLGFGPEALVVSPSRLRESIGQISRETAARYVVTEGE